MEWSNVHDERPSCSTSGGQSEGVSSPALAAGATGAPFIIAVQFLNAAPELQDRHLYMR